jgi:hypothetical protein
VVTSDRGFACAAAELNCDRKHSKVDTKTNILLILNTPPKYRIIKHYSQKNSEKTAGY